MAGLLAVLDVANGQEVPLVPFVLLLLAESRLGQGLGLLAVEISLSRRLVLLMPTRQGV